MPTLPSSTAPAPADGFGKEERATTNASAAARAKVWALRMTVCRSISNLKSQILRAAAPDAHVGRLQTFGVGSEFYTPRRAGLRADDDEAEAVVGGALLRPERLVARRVAVVHGD